MQQGLQCIAACCGIMCTTSLTAVTSVQPPCLILPPGKRQKPISLRTGRRSPYFSDIPAQFLAHLRHHALLDARLLAVMDVECRELAAEIATDDPATPILIDDEAFDDVRLSLSASASLAAYDWQVHENAVPAGRTYSLVWRDPAEQVQCAAVSAADFSLLQQLHDAPDSVNTLIAALRDCLADAEAQRLPLRHALRHWLALGVLYPV